MKRFYLIIMMMFSMFSCHAFTREISSTKEIFEYLSEANSQTLIIFDVDMVLIQPSDSAFQMKNIKHFSSIAKRIMKDIPPNQQMIFLSLMSTGSQSILIDENIPSYLKLLFQRKIPTMAMTANLTGEFDQIKSMEKWRINNLLQLGIDFSQTAPYHNKVVFENLASYRGYFSTYLDGIFFVNGTIISKGEALLAFLNKIHFKPSKIIFIDDREENLKSVEAALQKFNPSIEFVGFHFLGAQFCPSKLISEDEFELKWQNLAEKAKQLN